MKDVRQLGESDIVSICLDITKQVSEKANKFRSCVQVVYMNLDNMSRGIRPVGVPDHSYRIRLGLDTKIADLVSSLRRQQQHDCTSFDFGGIFLFEIFIFSVAVVYSEFQK